MIPLKSTRIWIFIFWSLLMAVTIIVRPLLPIDETRYVAVAWEMWVRHDFLVPHLNGDTYSHKPPLLFWLMQLTWWLFGVNEWSHRLIAPAFSLAIVYLSIPFARNLWPDLKAPRETVAYILFGFFIWLVFSSLTMFDMMLAFFALLGVYSILKASLESNSRLKWWVLLGLAIGGGVMSKGPVILVHVLPLALLAPFWVDRNNYKRTWLKWYSGVLFAFIVGAALALSWAIPAGLAGGESYRNAIFLGQTSGRLVKSFAHRLPWWWYLQWLPVILMPWLIWKPFWHCLKSIKIDYGLRFCMYWLIPILVIFSLISGKRIHYLIPWIPGMALCLARLISENKQGNWGKTQTPIALFIGVVGLAVIGFAYFRFPNFEGLSPIWGGLLVSVAIFLWLSKADNMIGEVFNISLAALFFCCLTAAGYFSVTKDRYDVNDPGKKIASLIAQNKDVAYYGKYHGQYNFAGRLPEGLNRVENVKQWSQEHRNGYIAVLYKKLQNITEGQLYYQHPFRNRTLALVSTQQILNDNNLQELFP